MSDEQKKRPKRKRKKKRPAKAPPTLGVSVSDAVVTKDKTGSG